MIRKRKLVLPIGFALLILLYKFYIPSNNEKYFEAARLDMEERSGRVMRVCKGYGILPNMSHSLPNIFKHPPTPQYSVFYIDRKRKQAYCPLYKAGSTSWLHTMSLAHGATPQQIQEFLKRSQISTLARSLFPSLEYPQAHQELMRSRKVLIVRHPFERLLSAYRDKLENSVIGREHGSLHYYSRYGRRIVAKYRPGGNSTHTRQLLRPGTFLWENVPPAGVEPTFAEFVQYLLDLDLANYADDHWIPYYMYCTPCFVNYDYIAKVETLGRDQVYMLRRLGLEGRVPPQWRHKTSTSDVSSLYFKQLTKTQVLALYHKYKLDFELFHYDKNPYLEYAMD